MAMTLASAAACPRANAFGEDVHPRLAGKAAALMRSSARGHALIDGNERLAWAATRILHLMDGRDLVMDIDDAETLVLGVASGQIDSDVLGLTLAEHVR